MASAMANYDPFISVYVLTKVFLYANTINYDSISV